MLCRVSIFKSCCQESDTHLNPCRCWSAQSVVEQKYDHLSAIYHLLLDRCRKHSKLSNTVSPSHLPLAMRTERRSSITTGIGIFSLGSFLSILICDETVFSGKLKASINDRCCSGAGGDSNWGSQSAPDGATAQPHCPTANTAGRQIGCKYSHTVMIFRVNSFVMVNQ